MKNLKRIYCRKKRLFAVKVKLLLRCSFLKKYLVSQRNRMFFICLFLILLITIFSFLVLNKANSFENPILFAKESLDLETRERNYFANEVFADNILLALHYFKGDINSFKKDLKKAGPENIDWEKVRKPFSFSISLASSEVFAFHPNVLSEFEGNKFITQGSKYNYEDGYKTVAGLYGNGVCHLATFMNWVVSDFKSKEKNNKLEILAKVDHGFAPIPGVDRQYGVSIYYSPSGERGTKMQNFYIKNNANVPIELTFAFDGRMLDLKVAYDEDWARLADNSDWLTNK